MTSLFITGANGFIGSYLLARLDPRRYDPIYCLARSGSTTGKTAQEDNFRWLVGSLFDTDVYGGCLDSSDVVIHLAAATGKARREQYFTVNSAGTQHLLAQCKQRGVKKFLYVSSIAAKYRDKSHYYYAQSKQEGEEAVRQSGLNYTILRPTIVLGKESPGWKALSRIARLQWVPVLGGGTALIQPIDVNDLVDAMISIVEEEDFHDESFDLGGPDVLSMEKFLRKVHRLYYRDEPRVIHLPLTPLKWIVACSERYFPRLMPLNAGQLSVFVQDGTITWNRLYEKHRSRMKNLDTVLKTLTANAAAR